MEKKKAMKINKAFQMLIPPLSSEEYQYLEDNILKDGVREPLVTWGNTLIDGHNRYEICRKHGIAYKTVEKEFQSIDEAKMWIILNQFGRRNLTTFQRSELALKLKPMLAAQAKERQKTYYGNQYDKNRLPQNSAEVQNSETRENLAQIAGVSRDTIKKVSVIKEKGSKEQIERARAGGKGNSVNAVYGEVIEVGKTKKCAKCGIEKSSNNFYAGKNTCKSCINMHRRELAPVTDFKGDLIPITTDDVKNLDVKDIVASLYDTNKIINITADDLTEDIVCSVSDFTNNINRCLTEYEVDMTEDSVKRIKAALSKAEAAIDKMKRSYLL